jgi:hypothetical protein
MPYKDPARQRVRRTGRHRGSHPPSQLLARGAYPAAVMRYRRRSSLAHEGSITASEDMGKRAMRETTVLVPAT